jgi:benzoyl-CoA reductase/2-hydroxyglutaryl-CoA dehydratase subunit BcrC/BadD/HgdB
VPIEIIYAASLKPIDLNNAFISSKENTLWVQEAEEEGLPRNLCAWIKGIFTASHKLNVGMIIGVVEGDCSNTQALLDLWRERGLDVISFSYPADRDEKVLRKQLEKLAQRLGVSWKDVTEKKLFLDEIRKLVWELDRLTWEENKVSGFENHYFLISASDFMSDPRKYRQKLEGLIKKAQRRKSFKEKVRVGYVGVPPIFPEIYDYIEKLGGRVVFNEVQRQFSFPFKANDLVEQYLFYTFPYDVFSRIKDIKREIKKRQIDGVIHYTQSFCHRAIHDLILRKELSVPVVTIEGDKPFGLDARTKLRIQTFLEMISH